MVANGVGSASLLQYWTSPTWGPDLSRSPFLDFSLSPLLAVPHSTPSQPLKLRFLLVLLLLRLPLPRSSTSSSSISSSCRRCSQHRHSHARARALIHTHRIAISLSGGRAAGLPSPSFPPTVSRDPTTSSPSTPWSQGGDPPSLRLLAPLRLPAASAKRAGWRWQAFARLYVYPCLSRLLSSLALARPSVQEKRVRRRDPWLRPPLYPLINIRRHDQPVHRRRVPLIGCGYTATSPRYAEPTSSFRGIAKWNWTDRPFKGSSSVVMGLRRLCEDGLWPGEGRRSGFEGGIIDFWVDRCNGSVFGNIEWGGRGRDVSFRKFGVFVENAIWLALVYLSRSTDIRQFPTSSRFHRSRFLSKSSLACWDSLIAKDYYGWDFNFHAVSLADNFQG